MLEALTHTDGVPHRHYQGEVVGCQFQRLISSAEINANIDNMQFRYK